MRRNTHKRLPDGGEVFDATIEVPVTIRNPDKPIGTHVFTAVARTDAGLRWTAVTIDSGDDAKDALDRITIPQEVLDRIAPTALPRSSIIISDEPLSRETNYRTEFVAVLNNQPQGGFVTRQPTADVRVARRNAGATTASCSGSASASGAIGSPKMAIPAGAAARRTISARPASATISGRTAGTIFSGNRARGDDAARPSSGSSGGRLRTQAISAPTSFSVMCLT